MVRGGLDDAKHLLHNREANASRLSVDLAAPRPPADDSGPGDQRARRRHGAARADGARVLEWSRPLVDLDPAALRDRPDRRTRAGGRPARRYRPLPDARVPGPGLAGGLPRGPPVPPPPAA